MFGPRIKLDRELHRRLQEAAEQRGYASVDELIVHVLEQAVADTGAGDADAGDDAEVEKQLRGLGYIE